MSTTEMLKRNYLIPKLWIKNKRTIIIKKKRLVDKNNNEEDTNVACIVCAVFYSKSKSGEPWIQCQSCTL